MKTIEIYFGDLIPEKQKEFLNALGIRVLDHFIFTPTDYLSLREERGDLFN